MKYCLHRGGHFKPKRGILAFICEWRKNKAYVGSINVHKREQIVYQLQKICIDLQDTKEGFQVALEHFANLAHINETGIEHIYPLLNKQYRICRSKADAIGKRIEVIKNVSRILFIEWEYELNVYTNRVLRKSSKQQLKLVKQDFFRLMKMMQNTEKKIRPILATFKDQALYLKHHLNARAISALQYEFIKTNIDISDLIQAMEKTIAEAIVFVSVLVDQQTDNRKNLPDDRL